MFQPNVCDGCILNLKSANYHCIIGGISKSQAISLMQNTDLIEKSRTL